LKIWQTKQTIEIKYVFHKINNELKIEGLDMIPTHKIRHAQNRIIKT
jgi:hypothetical protein